MIDTEDKRWIVCHADRCEDEYHAYAYNGTLGYSVVNPFLTREEAEEYHEQEQARYPTEPLSIFRVSQCEETKDWCVIE